MSKVFLSTICIFFISVVATAQNKKLPTGFSWVKNIEMIMFCVPAPISEYKKVNAGEKAKHRFINIKNKNYEMEIAGLLRADTTVFIDDYFEQTYATAEEEGKIIEEKKLIKTNNCFYAKGYMNNLCYKERFIEITWLRKDDVVKFTVNYSVKDNALWNKRLKTISSYSSVCN
jgi:hypothetical protein